MLNWFRIGNGASSEEVPLVGHRRAIGHLDPQLPILDRDNNRPRPKARTLLGADLPASEDQVWGML
jgi:hypothetical protein